MTMRLNSPTWSLPGNPKHDYPAGQLEAPRAPLDPNEGVLAAEFVRRHARVDWTFTQHGTGGIFRHCRVGIWTEDNQTALHDVHALCRHVGNEVLNTPNPNQAMVSYSRKLVTG